MHWRQWRTNKRDSKKLGKAGSADIILKQVHLEMDIDKNAWNHCTGFLFWSYSGFQLVLLAMTLGHGLFVS